jgi:hypothetical protein
VRAVPPTPGPAVPALRRVLQKLVPLATPQPADLPRPAPEWREAPRSRRTAPLRRPPAVPVRAVARLVSRLDGVLAGRGRPRHRARRIGIHAVRPRREAAAWRPGVEHRKAVTAIGRPGEPSARRLRALLLARLAHFLLAPNVPAGPNVRVAPRSAPAGTADGAAAPRATGRIVGHRAMVEVLRRVRLATEVLRRVRLATEVLRRARLATGVLRPGVPADPALVRRRFGESRRAATADSAVTGSVIRPLPDRPEVGRPPTTVPAVAPPPVRFGAPPRPMRCVCGKRAAITSIGLPVAGQPRQVGFRTVASRNRVAIAGPAAVPSRRRSGRRGPPTPARVGKAHATSVAPARRRAQTARAQGRPPKPAGPPKPVGPTFVAVARHPAGLRAQRTFAAVAPRPAGKVRARRLGVARGTWNRRSNDLRAPVPRLRGPSCRMT